MNENHLQVSLQENFTVRRSSPSCYAIDVIDRCGKVLVGTSSTASIHGIPFLINAYSLLRQFSQQCCYRVYDTGKYSTKIVAPNHEVPLIMSTEKETRHY